MTDKSDISVQKPEHEETRVKNEQDHPLSNEEKLEEGLEDSMDASDPPAVTHPGDHGEPVPSSGYKEEDA